MRRDLCQLGAVACVGFAVALIVVVGIIGTAYLTILVGPLGLLAIPFWLPAAFLIPGALYLFLEERFS